MTELISLASLLKQLLENGSIKIEITISSIDQTVYAAGNSHEARCKYCGWRNKYASEKIAKRALNGHLAQCKVYEQTRLDVDEIPDWLRYSSEQSDQ